MQFFSHILVFGTLFVLCLTDGGIHNLTQAFPNCEEKIKASALLDAAKDLINKAKDMDTNCVKNQKKTSDSFLNVAMKLILEVKKDYSCPETDDRPIIKHVERPMDCSDILRSGKNESGVYTIWPRSPISTNKSITVFCDMDTDGGGWTVIQRRGKFSTPKDYFYKDWASYKNGFGNLMEEFWLGNDNIYIISNQAFLNKPYKIRFDLKDASGKAGYAEYSTFWIEDEASSYTFHIEGYKGNAGDIMSAHDKRKFSAKDRKNDLRKSGSCAVDYQGAWWYRDCTWANLNGLYQPGIESHITSHWHHFTNNKPIGLSGVEIKLRF